MELNKYIDHTNLKANANKSDISLLCEEARTYGFASVCVNPCYVKYASDMLKGSNVAVVTVIGFPLGANLIETKVCETKNAIKDGADELDLVINIGAIKEKNYDYIESELDQIIEVLSGKVLKVIIETSYLSDEEIIYMCNICRKKFVHFIKTSTGFSEKGASVEVVKLIKEHSDNVFEIKASGGIKNYNDAVAMIDAGATRIGTSNGIVIMEGLK